MLPVPAFKRCVHKLIRKIEDFRRRREGVHPKMHDVAPRVAASAEPAWDELTRAVVDEDYAAFRAALSVYEDSLAQRVGRQVERFPTAAAALGGQILVSAIVEEVFLNAFEQFAQAARKDMALSQWLEQLVAPSIRHLLEAPDTATENVAFAQTLLAP